MGITNLRRINAMFITDWQCKWVHLTWSSSPIRPWEADHGAGLANLESSVVDEDIREAKGAVSVFGQTVLVILQR
jgi:hypothetical protein